MSDKRIVLGCPQVRGNTDGIFNYEADPALRTVSTAGFAAGYDGVAKLWAAGVPFGVLGDYEKCNKQIAICREGMKVGVRCAAGAAPVIGAPVYVTTGGLFTSEADGTTATRAVFASQGLGQGVDPRTGATVEACAFIDMVGGF